MAWNGSASHWLRFGSILLRGKGFIWVSFPANRQYLTFLAVGYSHETWQRSSWQPMKYKCFEHNSLWKGFLPGVVMVSFFMKLIFHSVFMPAVFHPSVEMLVSRSTKDSYSWVLFGESTDTLKFVLKSIIWLFFSIYMRTIADFTTTSICH